MLVFIGLILVYGLLFAILAVSKAILEKDKKPPTSSKNNHMQSHKKPAYSVKMRGYSCKAAQSLLLRLQGVLPSQSQSHARSFMTQTVNARTVRSEKMTKPRSSQS